MNCPHCATPILDGSRFCGACGRTISSTQEVSHAGAQSSSTAEAPQLIGREIAGRYRVNAKLGEGGMGAVYKAEQMSLKRTVAVKLLRPEVASSQMLLARFNAEAQAVAKLSHPNTVNIYDFGQDHDGTLFIAMEFIEGQSLRQVIHGDAPLPLRRALNIAAQVAASIADAHAMSIVHRDLKPDNVMLQGRGKQKDIVRVLDFGIAKLRDENRSTQMAMTQAGDMLGTPQYMAPEQIRAENVDGRTDVYALGCILYEMITGRLPFEAPTVMALLSKHLLETVVPPSQRRPELHLPPSVDHLILGAMAKDVNARPPTMEKMGELIASLLSTLPADTQRSTAQVDGQSSTLAAPTPPPSHAPFAPHAPPPGGYQTAPATPPPGHPGFSPPPSGYVPPGTGAPAYDPHAGRPAYAPAPAPAKKSSNAVLWIVLGALVLGGAGAGIYFGAIKKDPVVAAGSGEGSDDSEEEAEPSPDPDPDPGPTPGSNVADPWSGGSGATAATGGGLQAPADALPALQGIKVVLPAGFTVVKSSSDQWAAANLARGAAIVLVALPPGTDDIPTLAREYAKENGLTIAKGEDSLIAGETRHLAAFLGKVNGQDALQAGTVLIGPGYRVAVFFHIMTAKLKTDPAIADVADAFFLTGLYVPTPNP